MQTTQGGIQNVLGALYASVIFLGIINSIVLQPIAAENRGVMYRERAAGMYAVFPWTLAMVSACPCTPLSCILPSPGVHTASSRCWAAGGGVDAPNSCLIGFGV